eukprot:382583-Ditylum_brightwellii.AAC.1
MDTAVDDAFYMHLSNGDKTRIGSARKGTYVIDKHPKLSSKDIWNLLFCSLYGANCCSIS